MKINTRELFERELSARGLSFSIDEESGRHAISIGGGRMLVSLENLDRDLERDGNLQRVSNFVDAIFAAVSRSEVEFSSARLLWSLEPNDYADVPEFRVPISAEVDRVLVHVSEDGTLITWVTRDILNSLNLTESEAERIAFENLSQAAAEVSLHLLDIDDASIVYIETTLPFKAPFILAPNLREVVSRLVGWPVLAVVPDRNFLYMWGKDHADLIGRVGPVVVDEYASASYPISTEVYEISDDGVRAIGAFPKNPA